MLMISSKAQHKIYKLIFRHPVCKIKKKIVLSSKLHLHAQEWKKNENYGKLESLKREC